MVKISFFPSGSSPKMFRGKYLEELKRLWEEDKLVFHGTAEKFRNHYTFKELLDSCYGMDWIPHCKKTFNGAQTVIKYLGKYTHRIAVSNHRIVRMDDDTVTFLVKDYRNEGQWKELTISGVEFVRRFSCMYHHGVLSASGTTDCYVPVLKARSSPFAEIYLDVRSIFQSFVTWKCLKYWKHLYGIKVCVCKGHVVGISESHR